MVDYSIRAAHQSDVMNIARVRVDTWRSAYKDIFPDDVLAGLSVQSVSERVQRKFWQERAPGVEAFVAETRQKDIVGIAMCGPEQSQDPVYHGEVYVLYVLPAHQKHGIGRRLVAACAQHLLRQLTAESMLIWVIAQNPYRVFYDALGGKVVKEKTREIEGEQILEVGYGWQDIHGLAAGYDPI